MKCIVALWAVAIVALSAPVARAGSYDLVSVGCYYSQPVSLTCYSDSAGLNSLTASGHMSGGGSPTSGGSYGYSSLYASLDTSAYAYLYKQYEWTPSGSYESPSDYTQVSTCAYQGTASSTATGSCSANARGGQVNENSSVSNSATYSWASSGSYTVYASGGYGLSTQVSASVSTGTSNANISQSASFDVWIQN